MGFWKITKKRARSFVCGVNVILPKDLASKVCGRWCGIEKYLHLHTGEALASEVMPASAVTNATVAIAVAVAAIDVAVAAGYGRAAPVAVRDVAVAIAVAAAAVLPYCAPARASCSRRPGGAGAPLGFVIIIGSASAHTIGSC